MNIASMKWLPLTLAALHGSLVVIVFSAAYIDPERHGLAPVVLLFSDLLFSMLLESIRKALHDDFGYGQLDFSESSRAERGIPQSKPGSHN